ncbi:MAG: hypothetical protein M1839_005514 [Geoglossum umbratile]|nr:MAG: hypothetical protein M1839_005514 [Geoglossum umbratile]
MTHALVTMLLEEEFAEEVIEEFAQDWRGVAKADGADDTMGEGAVDVIKGKKVKEVGGDVEMQVQVPFGAEADDRVAFGTRQLILPYWLSTIELASSTPPAINTRLQDVGVSVRHFRRNSNFCYLRSRTVQGLEPKMNGQEVWIGEFKGGFTAVSLRVIDTNPSQHTIASLCLETNVAVMTEPAWTIIGGVIMHMAGAPITIPTALMISVITYELVDSFIVNSVVMR